MTVNSHRNAARLTRVRAAAIPGVMAAFQAGELSLYQAEIIARYSPIVQELMLPETVKARPKPEDSKVLLHPGFAQILERQETLDALNEEIRQEPILSSIE